MVALTFDDGPDQPRLLEHSHLKEIQCQSYLLMVGKNVSANPDIAKQSHQKGHQIRNMPGSPSIAKVSLDNAKKEILDAQRSYSKRQVCRPRLPVTPYGAINKRYQYGVDQSFIMWDVDSLDWKTHNTTAILNGSEKVKPGSIILMHDIHQTTIDALPLNP